MGRGGDGQYLPREGSLPAFPARSRVVPIREKHPVEIKVSCPALSLCPNDTAVYEDC